MMTLGTNNPFPLPGSAWGKGLYLGVLSADDGQPYALVARDKPHHNITFDRALQVATRINSSLPSPTEAMVLMERIFHRVGNRWVWVADKETTRPDCRLAWGLSRGSFSVFEKAEEKLTAWFVDRHPISTMTLAEGVQ